MPAFLTAIFLLLGSICTWCQDDSMSNSFERVYRQSNSALKYSYDETRQIHDYTGNWDFDADGKTDKLLFIGTGGAHLYFYLQVVLSSDSVIRNYHLLESDFPLLAATAELERLRSDPLNAFPTFAVFDVDGDCIDDIFIRLDTQSFESSKKKLKKNGITSPAILLTFKNGKTKFKNYPATPVH